MSELSNYKCVNGRILIEKIVQEEVTQTGIILVEKAKKSNLSKGKVILSGDPLCQEGEVAYHRPGIGYDIILDSRPYLIVKATEIELVKSK
jgi:co-chaperonin GroES (HSP10)